MRKATLIAIALLLPAVSLLASPVKKSAAKATATAFLQKQVSHSNGAKHAPRKLELVSAEADNAPYYVFNNTNGQGFAIVSGEDTANEPIPATPPREISLRKTCQMHCAQHCKTTLPLWLMQRNMGYR